MPYRKFSANLKDQKQKRFICDDEVNFYEMLSTSNNSLFMMVFSLINCCNDEPELF